MSVKKPNILVLDANQRSALAVTRSLGKSKAVNVFTADADVTSLAGYSKYSCHYLRCPSSAEQGDVFIDWIQSSISKYNFHAVFPVTEITSQLLMMNRACLGNCRLPFADYETVMSLADKGKLHQLARSANIPVPEYRLFDNASQVNIEAVDTFPVVIKPCLSRIWVGGQWISTTVKVVNSRGELSQALNTLPYLQQFPFMLQSFIPGYGAGLFTLYNAGKPLAYFSHRRIREKPPRGGVSVVSESVAANPQLREYTEKLLTAVNWHGVAMVEFRISEQGLPFLMEVNTRFWGSLQLAIDAGVDFPYMLWQLISGDTIPVPGCFQNDMQNHYRIGQRLRWLLGDLDSLYLSCKDSDYSMRQKLRRAIDFFTPSFTPCRHEVNRWEDPKPAWFELRQYLNDLMR
jgi:predicted ATP-grasp superfamily ATP-dependent carboligase